MDFKRAMDLCIVADFTGSMKTYLDALKSSMLEFIHILKLCDDIDRVSVLGYSDYCEPELIKWSEWKKDAADLVPFVNDLYARGGGDDPEASKTAIFELTKKLDQNNQNKRTLVIWYTDAPPHTKFTGSHGSNIEKEQRALGDNFDWVTLCAKLARSNCSVWVLLPCDPGHNTQTMYSYLTHVTDGKTLLLRNVNSHLIGTTTVGLVLAMMGHAFHFPNTTECYIEGFLDRIQNEQDLETHFIQNNRNEIKLRKVEPSTISPFHVSGQAIVHKFARDAEYRDLVYKVFEDILTPQLIKSLTYNPLFGTLWREICKDRHDERRNTCVNRLSTVISNLRGDDKTEMQSFIEQSYNQIDRVHEIVTSVAPETVVVLDRMVKMTSKDILEITRSCSPSSLRQLNEILMGLKKLDEPFKHKKYIPMALDHKDFFACLPHLVVDGIMFSLRASVVMAMLVIYTGTDLLMDKATQHVIESRGKWFIKDQPENFSYEFIKFALCVDRKMQHQCLTEEERTLYQNLHTVGGLKINSRTTLQLKLPFTSSKTRRPDYKFKCTLCHEMRSFTLLNEKGECGLCLCDEEPYWFPSVSDTHSYWCECKTCKVHYAVEEIDRLNVVPKCHFCRENRIVPSVQCVNCKNDFVCCNPNRWPEHGSCPICVEGEPPCQDIEVSVQDYIYIENGDTIFWASLWSLYQRGMSQVPHLVYPAVWNGKPVLNAEELRTSIQNWIALEKAELGTCMLCFNDMNKSKLHDVCDLKKCHTKACVDCLSQWYGEPKPGRILSIGNLTCMFCRKPPTFRILRKYNKELCTLKAMDDLHKTVDSSYWYAWCVKCYQGKKYVAKECAAEAPPVTRFTCEDCQDKGDVVVGASMRDVLCKPCPKCEVMVEKTSGCDHITCACGSHWCFACNELSTERDIYHHMMTVHGGIGLTYDDYDSDGYGYDYDE